MIDIRHLTTPLAMAACGAIFAVATSATPATAKTCKEPLTVTSRSTIKTSEEARTKRATDNAEKKWSKEVRAKYGVRYYFWMRSDAKSVECRQTPKSSICIATATPCGLF